VVVVFLIEENVPSWWPPIIYDSGVPRNPWTSCPMRRTPETKTVGHGPLPSGTLASLLVMVLECRRSRTSYGLLQRNIAHFSFPFCTIDEDDEDDSDWEFDES